MERASNCLNLVRLAAAFQVMFGHMIEHLGLPISGAVLRSAYFLRGVPIFFVISGFLIWFSIERSKSYGQYIKKRFLRIYPELWTAVLIELIVLIIFYEGGWNLKDLLLFAFCQGTLFQFWTPDSLRGYGVGTPNGALWTIGVMIQFYIIVWPFYKFMKSRKFLIWIIGFAVSVGISSALSLIVHEIISSDIVVKLYSQTFIEYFWLFYIGMFVAEFKDKLLPIFGKFWFIFLIVAFVLFWTGLDFFSGYYLGWSLFLTIGLIGFAYRFPQLNISPDISYGLFLYHMTVLNIFVYFGWKGRWIYTVSSTVIVIILAGLSTMMVGKRVNIRKANTI